MTEDKPHVVFPKDIKSDCAFVCENYAEAHQFWSMHHSYQTPWLIAVLGRVIDPSTPIVDVNE